MSTRKWIFTAMWATTTTWNTPLPKEIIFQISIIQLIAKWQQYHQSSIIMAIIHWECYLVSHCAVIQSKWQTVNNYCEFELMAITFNHLFWFDLVCDCSMCILLCLISDHMLLMVIAIMVYVCIGWLLHLINSFYRLYSHCLLWMMPTAAFLFVWLTRYVYCVQFGSQ